MSRAPLVLAAVPYGPCRDGRSRSHPPLVELAALAAAVALERARLARRVGTLEDPVLPGGEPAEDLALDGLGAGEAERGLHAGERVGREARALLEDEAYLVGPVDVVGGEGDEPRRLRRPGVERRADEAAAGFEPLAVVEEAAGEAAEPVRHGIEPEIRLAERDRRRRAVVALERAVEHVAAVGGEHELEKGAGEAASRLDERD